MKFCTCINEYINAIRDYARVRIILFRYQVAAGVLRDKYILLEIVRSRFVENLCHIEEGAGASAPPSFGISSLDAVVSALITAGTVSCGLLSWLIQACEFLVAQQKAIVDAEARLYWLAVKKYQKTYQIYIDCKNSLKKCKGCEREFKPKSECIKMCKGCEEDYCSGCFDTSIEAWERKQKENV